jgi:putative intracellular protease/amidase
MVIHPEHTMGLIGDFIAGRTHKLARDFLFTGFVIIALCFGAITLLSGMLQDMRVAGRQPLPPRVAANGPVQTQTIVRSVLDDNVTTASIGGRTIILDPCTGKEKK